MEVTPGFRLRAVEVQAAGERIYDEREWRDALVVVTRGEIELESMRGSRQRVSRGDVLWLAGLPLRAIHNHGADPAMLVAVCRDEFGDEERSKNQ
jgi:quercetin dioxygenase-like cupin family protein